MEWREAGRNCIMKRFIARTLRKTLVRNQIKDDEMGRTWGAHERVDKCIKHLVGKPE